MTLLDNDFVISVIVWVIGMGAVVLLSNIDSIYTGIEDRFYRVEPILLNFRFRLAEGTG